MEGYHNLHQQILPHSLIHLHQSLMEKLKQTKKKKEMKIPCDMNILPGLSDKKSISTLINILSFLI